MDSGVLFYRRYVDDTFCLFHSEQDATLFFNYSNNQHRDYPYDQLMNAINASVLPAGANLSQIQRDVCVSKFK